MRRAVTLLAIAALGAGLAGCGDAVSGIQDAIHDFNPMGSGKKKLTGERKAMFPEGVPGVQQGVPPELMKGARREPDPVVEATPTPAASPKSRKVRTASPAQPRPPKAAKPATQTDAGAAPPPARQAAKPRQAPAAPAATPAAAPGGWQPPPQQAPAVAWPDPPKTQ